MAKPSSCSRPRLLTLYQSAPSPLCLGVQEKEEVELALYRVMTQILGQFWKKSSAPSVSSLASCCWSSKKYLQHQPTLPAGTEQGKVQFLKQHCDCEFATPDPLKKKIRKKMSKSSPPSTVCHLLAVCSVFCVRMHLWRHLWRQVAVLPVPLMVWEWAAGWGLAERSGKLAMPSVNSGLCPGCSWWSWAAPSCQESCLEKLVLRHQQKPYAHVLILSVFLQEVLNLALAASLQQV